MDLLAQFNLLYNNINSNQSPGLSKDEIVKFLNQAQDEIIRCYFTPKGNKWAEGLDESAIRQADFSKLISTAKAAVSTFSLGEAHLHPNGLLVRANNLSVNVGTPSYESTETKKYFFKLTLTAVSPDTPVMPADLHQDPVLQDWESSVQTVDSTDRYEWVIYTEKVEDVWQDYSKPEMILSYNENLLNEAFLVINEWVLSGAVVINGTTYYPLYLITPLSYIEYERLMRKPYKLPLKGEAWRLSNNLTNNIEIVLPVKPANTLDYCVRYVRKPNVITVATAKTGNIDIDEILYYELVQRAVELAKAAYAGDIQSSITVGQTSGTNLGYVTSK